MSDDNDQKRCGFGKGHMAPRDAFYNNRTKPDGKNGICRYHQGVVDQRKR